MASEEQLNRAQQLRQELDEILFLQRNLTDEVSKSAKELVEGNEEAKALKASFRGVSNATAKVNASIRGVIEGEKTLTDLAKEISRAREAEKSVLTELSQIKQIDLNNELENKNLAEKQAIIKDYIVQQGRLLDKDAKKLLKIYSDQLATLEEQEEIFEEIQENQDKLGFTAVGDSIEGILKSIGAGGLVGALGFGQARKDAEAYALANGKSTSSSKLSAIYAKSIFANLRKALGPITIFGTLFKSLLKANEETVKLQKSFLLTSSQAVDFRQEMAAVADATGNVNITATKLLGTISSINEQFGFVARFSQETLVNTTKLVQQIGLSTTAANALAGLTELQGANAEELFKSTVATTLELQRQSGVQIDQREIFEQISKVSGVVRANLGSNPIEIAKAIQKSKEFGASLEQVAAASEQLLDFQSSIEAELQAELLIGRDINLQRARAAALAGDQVTLAQELQKQAGSFAEFSSMNVIQQEALAKAMGMSKDELADTLYQQELQLKGAEQVRAELAATGNEEAIRALEAQTAQDKFNATMEKLQAVVVDVATAFMPILDIVSSIASFIGRIISALGPLKGVVAGAAAGTAITPGIGTAIGAIVGGVSSLSSSDTEVGDIIPEGYGEEIVTRGRSAVSTATNVVREGAEVGREKMGEVMGETNQLLKTLVTQGKEKIQLSPIGLYQVQ